MTAKPNLPAYRLTAEGVTERTNTEPQSGLNDIEAKARLKRDGPNDLPTVQEKPWWQLLLRQLYSPLVIVLTVAAILAYTTGGESEAIAILAVIVVNTAIGLTMELRARRALHSLRELVAHNARVYRSGRLTERPAAEIVVGDILFLEAGELVPADARLLEVTNLSVDESLLTGESAPVSKQTGVLPEAPLAERGNMAYRGTAIVRGNGRAVATATGSNTEIGQTMSLLNERGEERTPLEHKLAVLGIRLVWISVGVALLLFALGLYRGYPLNTVLQTAIALAIAAIPEGLPVVATVTLAIGMVRLSRRNIIVHELRAVETLGETQLLLIDKTGTLTENELQLDRLVDLQGDIDSPSDTILKAMVYCNHAELGTEEGQAVGDPLEIALLRYVREKNDKMVPARDRSAPIAEIPFSSETRYMVTANQEGQGVFIAAKGALEPILQRCSAARSREGETVPVVADDWHRRADELSGTGYKTLALAYRLAEQLPEAPDQDLCLLGLLAFRDPPRRDVHLAVADCYRAGLRIIMATGDHPLTGQAIAREVGLEKDAAAKPVSGTELQSWLDSEDTDRIVANRVFARVSPRQKMDLLKVFQGQGLVVAMAGDGVNDIPAIRRADIGIAMGEGSSAAARETADLVLRDNSIASVVYAIGQGRGIFDNIRLFVVYLLSCNLSELLVIGGCFMLGFAEPLLAFQILFLNLVTDVFPALALGFTRPSAEVLDRPPRGKDEPVLTRRKWWLIGVYAAVLSVSVLGVNYLVTRSLGVSPQEANSLVFLSLLSAQLFHLFSLPSERESLWRNRITQNVYVWWAIFLCLLLPGVSYLLPAVRELLYPGDLRFEHLWIPVVSGLLPVVAIRLWKWGRRSAGGNPPGTRE